MKAIIVGRSFYPLSNPATQSIKRPNMEFGNGGADKYQLAVIATQSEAKGKQGNGLSLRAEPSKAMGRHCERNETENMQAADKMKGRQ
jgi:hypothetical protein